MWNGINIESIFEFLLLKKSNYTTSLVIKVDTKITITQIEKRLILEYRLHSFIRYNSAYRIK